MRRWIIVLAIVLLLLAAGGGTAVVVVKKKQAEATTKAKTAEAAKLAGLVPSAAAAVERLRAQLAAEGIETQVGETYRDPATQEAKFAAGLSAVKSLGWHQLRRAVHLLPMIVVNGKKQADVKGTREDLYRIIHQRAVAMGFTTIAFDTVTWKKRYIKNAKGQALWDAAHLEWQEGMTLAVARAKFTAAGGKAVA